MTFALRASRVEAAGGPSHPAGRLYLSATEAGAPPRPPKVRRRNRPSGRLLALCAGVHAAGLFAVLRLAGPPHSLTGTETWVHLVPIAPVPSPAVAPAASRTQAVREAARFAPIVSRLRSHIGSLALGAPAFVLALPELSLQAFELPREGVGEKATSEGAPAKSPHLPSPAPDKSPTASSSLRAAAGSPVRREALSVSSASASAPGRKPVAADAPRPPAAAVRTSAPAPTGARPQPKVAASRIRQRALKRQHEAEALAERRRAAARREQMLRKTAEIQRKETARAEAARKAEKRRQQEEARRAAARAQLLASRYKVVVSRRISAAERYPFAAAGASGVAMVRFQIDSTGHALGIALRSSAGDSSLDAAAVAAVRAASPFPRPPKGAPRVYVAPISFR